MGGTWPNRRTCRCGGLISCPTARELLLTSNHLKDKEDIVLCLFQQPQPLWPSQNWLWPLCMMLTSPCLARANRRKLFLHAQALAPNNSTRVTFQHQLLFSQEFGGGIAWVMRAATSEFRVRAIVSKLHQTRLAGFCISAVSGQNSVLLHPLHPDAEGPIPEECFAVPGRVRYSVTQSKVLWHCRSRASYARCTSFPVRTTNKGGGSS